MASAKKLGSRITNHALATQVGTVIHDIQSGNLTPAGTIYHQLDTAFVRDEARVLTAINIGYDAINRHTSTYAAEAALANS